MAEHTFHQLQPPCHRPSATHPLHRPLYPSSRRWRNILSTNSSHLVTDLLPPIRYIGLCTSLAHWSIHIVLPLQLPPLLLGPELIQVSSQSLGHVLILQIRIGIGIIHKDIISRLNRNISISFFLIDRSLT